MYRILSLLLCSAFLFGHPAGSYASQGGSNSHSSQHHSTAKKSKPSDSSKTVHVNGYYRKDGTYVAPYDRRPPGAAGSQTSYHRDYVAEGYTADPTVQRDKNGKIKRSKSERSAFMREHPCPSTGKTSGSCPGYVVDHVTPLECGGADVPRNMQWQTTAAGKAKDKTEGSCRL
jgi:hypothetical protein